MDANGQLQPLFMSDEEYCTLVPYNVSPNRGFVVTIDSTMFTAGQAINLYPMLRFRHPGEEWQIIPPTEQSVTVGRDNEGHFFIRSNQKTFDMRLTGIGITKGTGTLYDLQGRPLSGKPTRRGLYIQGNKKIFVR